MVRESLRKTKNFDELYKHNLRWRIERLRHFCCKTPPIVAETTNGPIVKL
jgi:hypothetical protein